MKKLLALAIALTACMVSCDDSSDKKGNTTIIYNIYNTPSQQDASKLYTDVTTAAATKAPAAQPGSKEWCDAVADVLKNSNALFLSDASYTDENLKKEIAYLNQNIAKCEKDATVTSFDWYTDAKKQAAASCNVPDGLNVQAVFSELYSNVMKIDLANPDCAQIDSDMTALYKKYAKEIDYLEMLEDGCDDQDCILNCTSAWWPADMDEEGYEMRLVKSESCSIDFNPANSDPCLTKTCEFNSLCIEGECVNTCDLIPCGPNATCNRNLGICELNQTTVKTCTEDPTICNSETEFCDGGVCKPKQAKTCTEDPSICNNTEYCDGGVCKPKPVDPPQNPCDKYPQTVAALKQLAATATSCQQLEDETDNILSTTGVSEGLTPEIFDGCWEDWMDALIPSANEVVQACISSEDINCSEYPQGKAAFVQLAKDFEVCEDLTEGLATVKAKLVTGDGASDANAANDIISACGMTWLSTGLSATEREDAIDRAMALDPLECSAVHIILGGMSIIDIGG